MTDQDSYGESSEVSLPMGATTLYGTLIRPYGPGPFPAVVMVAGSGPTDRDWNSPLLPGSNRQRTPECRGLGPGRDRVTALRQTRCRPTCRRKRTYRP